MEHVVFFPAHDGSPAFRRVASLDDAVRLVEHLRNVENVSEVSVHQLTEVPLAFKPWYRVEVPAGESEPAAAEQPVALAPVADPVEPVAEAAPELAPEASAEVPAPVEVPAQMDGPAGTRESGGASLGFFAS